MVKLNLNALNNGAGSNENKLKEEIKPEAIQKDDIKPEESNNTSPKISIGSISKPEIKKDDTTKPEAIQKDDIKPEELNNETIKNEEYIKNKNEIFSNYVVDYEIDKKQKTESNKDKHLEQGKKENKNNKSKLIFSGLILILISIIGFFGTNHYIKSSMVDNNLEKNTIDNFKEETQIKEETEIKESKPKINLGAVKNYIYDKTQQQENIE